GRGRVPGALWRSRGVTIPSRPSVRAEDRRDGASRGLRAGRIVERALRRQLELARPDLVSRELPPGRGAPEVSSLLWRHTESPVPGRLGPDDGSLVGRRRSLAAPHPHLPARRGWAPARVWRDRAVPVRSALARPDPLLRVLPRRRWRRHRRQPSD